MYYYHEWDQERQEKIDEMLKWQDDKPPKKDKKRKKKSSDNIDSEF